MIDLFNFTIRLPLPLEIATILLTIANLYLIYEIRITANFHKILHRYSLTKIILFYFIIQIIFSTVFKVVFKFPVRESISSHLKSSNEIYSHFIYASLVFLLLFVGRFLKTLKNATKSFHIFPIPLITAFLPLSR